MSDKKIPKKLYGGPVIGVSDQIIRWREKMRREGIALGKHMRKAAERAKEAREDRKTDTDDKLLKKKFF